MPPDPGHGEDLAPPKPPRPLAPEQQAESTLTEAFPSIDAAVVKAVLRASGGKVEPAFNALLGNYLDYLLGLNQRLTLFRYVRSGRCGALTTSTASKTGSASFSSVLQHGEPNGSR